MIFITLGGVLEFDFSRMLKIIDECVLEGKIEGEEIIAQIGCAKYEPQNFQWVRFIDGKEYEKFMNEADIIISHGGVGTIIKAIQKRKKVIAFPRMLKYKEHLDNHQLEITNKFANEGYIMCALDKESLVKSISLIDRFYPKEYIFDNSYMVEVIDNFIKDDFLLKR